MEGQRMGEKREMIAYILKLLEGASPEKVHKLLICAINILK